MNAVKRWLVLRWWRRRYGKNVCENCVYLQGVWCKRHNDRISKPWENTCARIFTFYDAVVQRLHYDRYAK